MRASYDLNKRTKAKVEIGNSQNIQTLKFISVNSDIGCDFSSISPSSTSMKTSSPTITDSEAKVVVPQKNNGFAAKMLCCESGVYDSIRATGATTRFRSFKGSSNFKLDSRGRETGKESCSNDDILGREGPIRLGSIKAVLKGKVHASTFNGTTECTGTGDCEGAEYLAAKDYGAKGNRDGLEDANGMSGEEVTSVISESSGVAGESSSVAEDSVSIASESNSVVVGSSSIASGNNSVASGSNRVDKVSNSVAKKNNRVVSGNSSIGKVNSIVASESNIVSSENNSAVSRSNSVAMANNNADNECNNIAIESTRVSTESNVVYKVSNKVDKVSNGVANQSNSVACNYNKVAKATKSVANDSSNATSGNNSIASGNSSVVSDSNSVASGIDNISHGNNTQKNNNNENKKLLGNNIIDSRYSLKSLEFPECSSLSSMSSTSLGKAPDPDSSVDDTSASKTMNSLTPESVLTEPIKAPSETMETECFGIITVTGTSAGSVLQVQISCDEVSKSAVCVSQNSAPSSIKSQSGSDNMKTVSETSENAEHSVINSEPLLGACASQNGGDVTTFATLTHKLTRGNSTIYSASRSARERGLTDVSGEVNRRLTLDTNAREERHYVSEASDVEQARWTNGNDFDGKCNDDVSSRSSNGLVVDSSDATNGVNFTGKEIVSARGTVRGIRNLVRTGVNSLSMVRNFRYANHLRDQERGKIVVYTTSMQVVRRTYERCKRVSRILLTHMVRAEKRDVYMRKEYKHELMSRLGRGGDSQVDLPQVFADGLHLGGVEELERLNESQELRAILKAFKKVEQTSLCERCGGCQYVLCAVCRGSKKSAYRVRFSRESCTLRCTACNVNGMIRCQICYMKNA